MLKVGVIGCGRIAQTRHLPEYAARKDVEVVGVFDQNSARAEEVAKQFGAQAYSSAEELIADKQIDAVSICTANETHAELAIASLRAGKHVLCEKPMGTTLEECEAMAAASRETGNQLMIDQNKRIAAAHSRARQLIAEGRIGKPLSFSTTFAHGGPETWSVTPGTTSWFFDKKRASLGAMADLGVHKTDLIQYLLGTTVAEVSAKIATLDKRTPDGELVSVDDNALCIYRMSDGVIGTMRASWTNYGPEDNSTIIYGDAGVMHLYDDPVHSIVIDLRDGTRELYDLDAIQTNDNQTSSGIIDAFVEGITDGTGPLISAESVLPAMRAVFAAVESNRLGKAIQL